MCKPVESGESGIGGYIFEDGSGRGRVSGVSGVFNDADITREILGILQQSQTTMHKKLDRIEKDLSQVKRDLEVIKETEK